VTIEEFIKGLEKEDAEKVVKAIHLLYTRGFFDVWAEACSSSVLNTSLRFANDSESAFDMQKASIRYSMIGGMLADIHDFLNPTGETNG